MPFIIKRSDITKMRVDAIVNAANSSLLGGGGVDGAIHRAAGPGLLKECRRLGGCATGSAKATKAYRLPAKYVIHTVGPIWGGGAYGEAELLASCYRESLRIARELGCESVAFPLISAGAYGYPKEEALHIAAGEIRDFLERNDMTVYLAVFDPSSFRVSARLMDEVGAYIDGNYRGADQKDEKRISPVFAGLAARKNAVRDAMNAARPQTFEDTAVMLARDECLAEAEVYAPAPSAAHGSIEELIGSLDESFSRNLLRRIDASGMTDAECYKRANIDRKLFSKIRSDPDYRPSKPTVIAFAVALRLDIDGTNDLLRRAGFALSHSSKFDVIVEYFITRGIYDVFEINEVLFAYDQTLLGAQA
ncbi:MAG: O-acetyl-ADP-ribose deacetylase [Clostridia bacterium]|nr:O-acetyl-ADP-ribose deacetylase [Clostridia bacterium]